jgi:hypothetical protein
MSKRIFVALAVLGALLALSTAGFAQEQAGVSPIQKAIEKYLREGNLRIAEEGPGLKAVPRTDKAEATIIGEVFLVDSTDFLDDGTPFRFVGVESNRPFFQDIFVVCLGGSFNSACGRLREGRRVQFTADVVIIEEGESAGLALLFVKKIKT